MVRELSEDSRANLFSDEKGRMLCYRLARGSRNIAPEVQPVRRSSTQTFWMLWLYWPGYQSHRFPIEILCRSLSGRCFSDALPLDRRRFHDIFAYISYQSRIVFRIWMDESWIFNVSILGKLYIQWRLALRSACAVNPHRNIKKICLKKYFPWAYSIYSKESIPLFITNIQ